MNNNFDLLLFGATRHTGLHIAEQAVKQGMSVATMVRTGSNRSALSPLNVHILSGDAFNPEDCLHILQTTKPKKVISVLGGKNAEGRRVDAEGNFNVIRAIEMSQPTTRFVLMTSMGCGDQFEGLNDKVKSFLGEALLAKTEAERLLQSTQLPWSIVRPGGLNDESGSGDFCLLDKPDPALRGYLSREDVATATLQVLEEKHWLHKIVTIQSKTLN